MNSKCSVQTLSIKASTLMMNFGHDTLIVSFRLAQRGESLPQKWMLSLSKKSYYKLAGWRCCVKVDIFHEAGILEPTGYTT